MNAFLGWPSKGFDSGNFKIKNKQIKSEEKKIKTYLNATAENRNNLNSLKLSLATSNLL
jgi:hypothetical protein